MGKRKVIQIGVVILVLFLFYRIVSGDNINQKKEILGYSEISFSPYMSETVRPVEQADFQENGIDYISPWMMARMAITGMYIEDNIELAEEIVECAMNTFYRSGCFPRSAYDQYEDGWVSCMDAPTVGVASQMLYEKTGEEKYSEYVEDLSKYILTDVKENGFTANINGDKWIFEFANQFTTEETGEFVLNGSLLGTLGIAMLANSTGDLNLRKLVQSQIENYKKLLSEYMYPDGNWCYYRLNAKQVNQPHYVIFEIRLFDALAEVTNQKLFIREAQRRRDAFLENYKIYYTTDNFAIGESKKYVFIRGGAPHYYYNDIYTTKLDFYNAEKELIKTEELSGREYINAFMDGEFPEETHCIMWTCDALNWSVEIGNLNIVEMSNIELNKRRLDYTVTTDEDASLNGDNIELNYEKGRGTLYFDFSSTVNLEPDNIMIIEIDNKSSQEISPTNLTIYDESGIGVGRYLKSIPSGKSCLYFSLQGFVWDETIDFNRVESLRLRLYIADDSMNPVVFQLGDIYKMESPDEWYRYLQGGGNIDWGA